MARIERGELTSYDQCAARIGKRDKVKLRNNVYLRRVEHYERKDSLVIQYHGTFIVQYYHDGCVRLNSNDWRTPSTKANLNRYTGLSVWQKAGEWNVTFPCGLVLRFQDGLTVVAQPAS